MTPAAIATIGAVLVALITAIGEARKNQVEHRFTRVETQVERLEAERDARQQGQL